MKTIALLALAVLAVPSEASSPLSKEQLERVIAQAAAAADAATADKAKALLDLPFEKPAPRGSAAPRAVAAPDRAATALAPDETGTRHALLVETEVPLPAAQRPGVDWTKALAGTLLALGGVAGVLVPGASAAGLAAGAVLAGMVGIGHWYNSIGGRDQAEFQRGSKWMLAGVGLAVASACAAAFPPFAAVAGVGAIALGLNAVRRAVLPALRPAAPAKPADAGSTGIL